MSAPLPRAVPDTSLIIPSRNRPRLLAETVHSVLAGDSLPAELVIIDQSDEPHEGLGRIAPGAGCAIRYLWKRDAGLSRARNDGVAAARHQVLAFIDDDMHVERDWFANLVRALEEGGSRCVVTGRVLPGEAETPGGFVPSSKKDETPATYAGRLRGDVLYPGNMAVHRSTMTEIGAFDERLGAGTIFPGAEDNDYGFRLLEAGFSIRYVPAATVYHRAWRSDLVRLRWGYGRGQGAFYAKHLALGDRWMLGRFARHAARHAFETVRYSAKLDRRGLGYGASVIGMLSGALEWRWRYGGGSAR